MLLIVYVVYMTMSILCYQLFIQGNIMRHAIMLTLVTYAVMASFNNNLFARSNAVGDAHSKKQIDNQNPPCMVNLDARLTKCDTSNNMQERMVLIRGQLLPVK